MTVLYVLIGIIIFFMLVLSIRVHISLDYYETPECTLKWLFIKIPIYPAPPKKDVKAKKQKEIEKAKDKSAEAAKEKAAPKENAFKVFFKKEGADGVLELLNKTVSALTGSLSSIIRELIIEELYLEMTVSDKDAAATAQKYGETCAKFFPLLGAVVTHMNVKKYDIDISPDYLAKKNKFAFFVRISASPRKIINSLLALLFKLLFGVVIKFLWGSRQKKQKTANSSQSSPEATVGTETTETDNSATIAI